MREIGSEFWDVPQTDTAAAALFPQSAQWFLSGRSALQAIIKELGEARSVALPSWCCDSMVKPFLDAGLQVHFYPIVFDGALVQEIAFKSDVLFLMDYFGYTGSAPDLNGYKGIVIRDVTHSLFSAACSDADYCFGSLRKWCGVWTGGYAWARDGHRLAAGGDCAQTYAALRERAMGEKRAYIEGEKADKGYLKAFEEAEALLEHAGIAPAAERDVKLAQRLDVEALKTRRRANAAVLRAAFPDWLIFPSPAPADVPMFVPVLVPDGKRDALRRFLIKNEIYCPIHWPVSAYHRLDERTATIYRSELSLVCDQRYTEKDMNREVEAIKKFLEA